MISKKVLKACKEKLLSSKKSYEHTLSQPLKNSHSSEVIDQAHNEINMQNSLFFRLQIKEKLIMIERALRKIENGSYGICEVTGETIGEKRLLAVPWTPVSIHAVDS